MEDDIDPPPKLWQVIGATLVLPIPLGLLGGALWALWKLASS